MSRNYARISEGLKPRNDLVIASGEYSQPFARNLGLGRNGCLRGDFGPFRFNALSET